MKKSKKFKRSKIGLALGSGGSKGLAHIGVIKVLEKNNIPIDYIAGSSIGAMVGGYYAATKNLKEMEKIAMGTDWKLLLSLIDPSVRQGLVGGKKMEKFMLSHIGKINFKDLQIPFSVAATDLKSGDAVVLNKGDVVSAVRASISYPLFLKPVEWKNKLLTDGGLSLPVPVDVVREMGADIIIAVNLDANYFNDTGTKNSKFGFYKIANNSINVLRHHLASWNILSADVVVEPQTGDIHLKKLVDGEDVILAGEKAMKVQMVRLKKLL